MLGGHPKGSSVGLYMHSMPIHTHAHTHFWNLFICNVGVTWVALLVPVGCFYSWFTVVVWGSISYRFTL